MDKLWILIGLATALMLAYMLHPFTGILVYSIFVYYITRPLYERILPTLKSKSVSAIASIVILALPVILVIMYTIGVASVEMNKFLAETDFQSVYNLEMLNETTNIAGTIKLGELLNIMSAKKDISNTAIALASNAGNVALTVISGAFNVLFSLFLVFVITFYLLIDGSEVRSWLKKTLLPKESLVDRFLDELDFDLSNVFHGNILTAGVIAVIASILFTVIGYTSNIISIPYPVLLGILCGIASFIPVVGVALVWLPLTIYLTADAYIKGMLPDSTTSILLFFTATYLLADWLPNMLLRPRMSAGRLHKGLLLLSYIFGPMVFGFKGLFLGPMVLVFAINFAEVVMPELVRK